jgi:hypothetical protein
MASISASYTFTPTLPGSNPITVTGESETDIKNAVQAAIAAKRAAVSPQVDACDAATAKMNA